MATHPLILGYKASAEQFGPRQLLSFAAEAEALGFESVWISDHFQPWRHTNGHAPFALSWLGACTGYLGHPFQKTLRDGERSPSTACKQRRVSVQSEVVNSILMQE